MPGGFLGVDIFFVISGFLITGIVEREANAGTFSLINFYERRVRRIIPALGAMILLVIPAAWVILTPEQLKQFGQSVAAVSLFSSNFLFWQQSGYFDVAAELKPLLHTWSLAVEEQFYVVFPLLLLACKNLKKYIRFSILIGLTLLSVAFAEFGASAGWASNFYLLSSRAWELLLGALLALVGVLNASEKGLSFRNSVSSAALVVLICSLVLVDKNNDVPGLLSLIPVGATTALLWSSSPGTIVYRLLSCRPLVAVGLMSYSVYLWHQPIFVLARHATRSELRAGTATSLIILTLLVSSATYRFVETPFRSRSWLTRRKIFSIASIFTLFCVVFGVAAQVSGGNFPGKRDATAREEQLREMAGLQIPDRDFDCHLNMLSKVDRYLEEWDCRAGSDSGLEALNVMVVGDSHAGVFAGAFLWNGFSIHRASGSGCSILRPENGFRECASILDLAVEEIENHQTPTVFLVNYWEDTELSELFITLTLEQWLPHVKHVVLMGPVPEFPSAHGRFVQTGEIELLANFEKADRFHALIEQMDLPDRVTVIDTASLLCGRERRCKFMDGDKLLWFDADHLAAEGSRRLGLAMIESGQLDFVFGVEDEVGGAR